MVAPVPVPSILNARKIPWVVLGHILEEQCYHFPLRSCGIRHSLKILVIRILQQFVFESQFLVIQLLVNLDQASAIERLHAHNHFEDVIFKGEIWQHVGFSSVPGERHDIIDTYQYYNGYLGEFLLIFHEKESSEMMREKK